MTSERSNICRSTNYIKPDLGEVARFNHISLWGKHATSPSRLSKRDKKILHNFDHRRTKNEGWKSLRDNLE